MKCRLANVVDNYFIMITDVQYYGIETYKNRFGGDEWVEHQFKHWFRHGYSVELTMKEFMTLSGLTYFGPKDHASIPMHAHISSALNIATAAKRGIKRVRKTGPLSAKSKKMKSMEHEIQVLMHSENENDHIIEIRDEVPAPKPGDLSESEMKDRLIVKADDGYTWAAAPLWLAGTYVSHYYSKLNFRNVIDLASSTSSLAFTKEQIYDFFSSPWMYHPDAGAQIMEIYNTIAPLHDKVKRAMAKIPSDSPFSNLTPNDLYKIINKGVSGSYTADGIPLEQIVGKKFSVQDFVDKFMGGDEEIILAVKGMGKYGILSKSPTRVSNLISSYFHFDPAHKLNTMTTMLYESLSLEYFKTIFHDLSPQLLRDLVDKAKSKLPPSLAEILNTRAVLGDKKSAVLREKIHRATAGTLLYSVGTGLQVYRLLGNTKELLTEIVKYKKGVDSKVKHALVKMLLDGDQAYNIAYYSMVGAMEMIGASAAVSSGVAISTFLGPASATTYASSIVLRQGVQMTLRHLVGMEQTIEMKATQALINAPKTFVIKPIKLTGKTIVNVAKAAINVGMKRKRVDDDIESAVRETKRRLEINDIESAVKIQNKMWHNRKYRRAIKTHLGIHI